MLPRKSSAELAPAPALTSPGPGQNPAIAHPMPNIAEPAISRGVRSRRLGIWKTSAITGDGRLTMNRYSAMCVRMPPTITKPRLGSQSPRTSRKPTTLVGWVMPASPSPAAKSSPASRYVRLRSAGPFMPHPRG